MPPDVFDLVIEGLELPPEAINGLRQSYEPIDAARRSRRDLRGVLRDASSSQYRKLRTVITGDDVDTIIHEDAWPGGDLVVHCIAELRYNASTGPLRPVREGSERELGDSVAYLPILTCKMIGFRVLEDHAGAAVGWELTLEETGGEEGSV